MLRLGDNMSDSREVLVTDTLADDDVASSSSIPEVADVVGVTSPTTRDPDAAATTELKLDVAGLPASRTKPTKSVTNSSSCIEVIDVQATTPSLSAVNAVR